MMRKNSETDNENDNENTPQAFVWTDKKNLDRNYKMVYELRYIHPTFFMHSPGL